jgi:hypothetical protein
LPEVIVDQRSKRACDQPNSEPNRLSFYEEINVSMAVVGKRTRAEKHDNADDQQSQDSQEKNVGTFCDTWFTYGAALRLTGANFLFSLAFGIESFCPIFNLRGSSM